MPRFLKDGIPAFLAIIAFLLAEVLSTLRPVSLNYELISNIVMLAIAVGGFFIVGLPSKQRTSNLSCVLSNLFVSIIAFPMNIDVFGHTIHWDNWLADLYWHFGWIICAIIQILFLTKLGESLLKQAVALLTWTQDKILAFGGSVRSIIDLLKRQDKGIVAIMGMSTLRRLSITTPGMRTVNCSSSRPIARNCTPLGTTPVSTAFIWRRAWVTTSSCWKTRPKSSLTPWWTSGLTGTRKQRRM